MIRKNQQLFINLQKVIDLVLMFASIILAFSIRFFKYDGTYLELSFYITGAIIISPIYLWVCSVCNLYKAYRTSTLKYEFLKIIESTLITAVIALALVSMLKIVYFSRLVMLWFVAINIILLTIFRFSLRIFLKKMRASGYNIKYILMIGNGKLLRNLSNLLKDKDEYGYAVTRFRGNIDNLDKYLENNLIDEIFISVEENESEILEKVYNVSEKFGIKINIIPSYSNYIFNRIYIDELLGIPIINVRNIPLDNLSNRIIKRIMDIIISICALIFLSPLMIVVAVLTKITSGGPVIYMQRRMGLNRKSFYMYKFRSMSIESSLKENIKGNEEERCTRFGKFIRKYKIDEIPQFFNVLVGNMSIVGPRPEITTLVKKYKDEIPDYMLKHRVKCGMTGLAQIRGYMGDTSIEKRIECDNEYINNWSIWLDIEIILLTIPYIIKKVD